MEVAMSQTTSLVATVKSATASAKLPKKAKYLLTKNQIDPAEHGWSQMYLTSSGNVIKWSR